MDIFKETQNESIGIGGRKCSCCNEYHGKDKCKLNRITRRRLKNRDKKMIEKELMEEQ
jgi:hypothetical protein